ncbi:hypothetical protein DTQ70_14770 [Runella sp. SP2]|nr:hypothetical protein DTQ70_14770 [Runella sp. SP2]
MPKHTNASSDTTLTPSIFILIYPINHLQGGEMHNMVIDNTSFQTRPLKQKKKPLLATNLPKELRK